MTLLRQRSITSPSHVPFTGNQANQETELAGKTLQDGKPEQNGEQRKTGKRTIRNQTSWETAARRGTTQDGKTSMRDNRAKTESKQDGKSKQNGKPI